MTRAILAGALMALLLSVGPALSADSGSAAGDIGCNAALRYWQAFIKMPNATIEENRIISDFILGRESKTTPEQYEKLLDSWQESLMIMRQAAAIPPCDWGVEYDAAQNGSQAWMGHLIPARQLSRATAFCARYLWEKGQRKEAAEDLRASLIMQRRIGHEGQDLLLPVLVQMSTERVTKKVIALLLTDREAADILVGVLGDLTNGSSAPLIENGLLSDKRVIHLNWDRRKPMPEATEILRNIQQADMPKLLDELEKQYDEAAALCGLPWQEFEAQLPALEEKFKASKNPLSTMLFSNDMIRTARMVEELYRVEWAMVRAAIAIRRDGEKALGSVLDPSNGKAFEYTALDGGAFELKSATLDISTNKPITMTFGHAAPMKN